MKIVIQWYFWLAIVFTVMLYQEIILLSELTTTRRLIIIFTAINIPLRLFMAYQKNRELKRLANFASLFL
ncbi:hypothetical protein [Enterococcus faecalis]|uniref:hypothetical protein n=1 Tax=Enterococcus faecalis TaxID=1351 RepID=UPI001A0EDEF6|nr:hypothetical protein [Enterococcus faecalis]